MNVIPNFRRCLLLPLVALAVTAAAQPPETSSGEPLRITSVTPSGSNVVPARQIVIQFNRPTVPIGRMERDDDELPIAITPELECEWRWIDTSALACQLDNDGTFRPATRYTVAVAADMTADDGTALGTEYVSSFTTETPRVTYVGFNGWQGPGDPVLRAVFNQPVSASSVSDHVYLASPARTRIPVSVEPDENDRTLPRLMPLPGEFGIVNFGQAQVSVSEDEREGRAEARRVWLLQPVESLPLDAQARLVVEPGLESADGPLPGDENRTAVSFHSFPEYEFLGVSCRTNTNRQVRLTSANSALACDPTARVGLVFSTPVISEEIRDHVTTLPDLAGGRTDYDPWANTGSYSNLRRPHNRGQVYTVWLPELLRADEPYRITAPDPDNGPRDEFGRTLPAPIDLQFRTDHRPPDFGISYTLSTLESAADSRVPLYLTNLEAASLNFRTLTPDGAQRNQVVDLEVADVEDVSYALPLGIRELLDGRSGAVYASLQTTPYVDKPEAARSLFSQVTPYQVHAKLGHFSSLVWVTDYATGQAVTNARVSIHVDRLANLSADYANLAEARTDNDGLAELPGYSTLNPDLDLLRYGCGPANRDLCPRLMVRVDHDEEMALLPIDSRFEINPYRVSNYSVYNTSELPYGHLLSWGTTAQGIYRAGDTIDFKIWVRDQSNETLVPAPKDGYRLEIIDASGRLAHTVDNIELSAFGAFDGQFTVPESAPVGWYQFRLFTDFDDKLRVPLRVLVTDFTPAAFRVSATLDGDRYNAGSEFNVEAEAALFSGGAWRDAETRITANLTPLSFSSPHPVAQRFLFNSESRRSSLQIAQTTGTVDDQGLYRESFSLPADLGTSMTFGRLLVEAAVRDDRSRFVAGTATARVFAVDRIVGLRLNQWVFSEDEPAEFESIVVDTAGTPVNDVPVTAVVERLQTRATRVRGAGNAFLTQYVDEWLPVANCEQVSTTDASTCRFVPEEPGRYRITARVSDTEGREHSTTLSAWVRGKGQVVWNTRDEATLEVIPEQSEFAVGDTARYLVQNPYPGAEALITIERYGVVDQWVETFDSSTPVLEFDIEPDYLPGFYLSILVMSPRVDGPLPAPGELDLGKPTYRQAYLRVPVVDRYRQLDIEIETDRESYKPRDTVSVDIKAEPVNRDQREPIEVAVVVLDEAVLDLIQGGTDYYDIYRGFNQLGSLDVFNHSLLTRLVGRQDIELKGANAGGDGGAALSMRSLFRFVAHFEPSLQLDRRGRGSLEFELPDNLTGWRVLVLGATPTDRLGLGQLAFTTTLPTEIRPLMPNQVSETDRFDAGASIMNRTDEARTLTVTIEAGGDLTEAVTHQETLTLGPYQRGQVRVPLTAARLPMTRDRIEGAVDLLISARDDLDGDALQHALPVQKRRVLQSAASFGSLENESATETLAFPDNILTDVGEVGIELYPSVIGNLDGAFRAARDSFYAFWESLLTRAIMASHYQSLEHYLADDFDWPGSASFTAAVLNEAANYQAPNGGMSWLVPQDAFVSPYLSAYTALAFAWLSKDGHEIPATVEERLFAYLDLMLRRDITPEFYSRGMASTVRAVALAALALRGDLSLADLTRYREHVEYMSLFGKAHYLIAAANVAGAELIAAEIGASIMQASVRSAGRISFNERLDDSYTRILASPMRTQCAILSALSLVPETMDGATAYRLVRTITLERGSRTHWENAQENVFCTRALVDYAREYEAANPNIEVTASLGDRPLGNRQITDLREPASQLMRSIEPSDPGNRSELRIDASGTGRVYYAARMSYADSAESSRRVNAGIEIRREVSVQRNGEWELLEPDAGITQGELVRVDLFLSLPTARFFVVVDDPVPGGLEPINRDLANASVVDADAGDFVAAGGSWYFQYSDWRHYAASRYSFHLRELRHDAARFYADYLPPGNYYLSYTAQAIAGGEYTHLPTRANEAYDPDVYGLGLTGTLTVERQ